MWKLSKPIACPSLLCSPEPFREPSLLRHCRHLPFCSVSPPSALLQLRALGPSRVRKLQCQHTAGAASSPLAPRRQNPNPRCLAVSSLHGNPPDEATCRERDWRLGGKTEDTWLLVPSWGRRYRGEQSSFLKPLELLKQSCWTGTAKQAIIISA